MDGQGDEPIGFDKQFAADIYDVHTEFVFQQFSNKWLLIITQFGKLPNIYNVCFDCNREDAKYPFYNGPINDPDNHVSVPTTMKCCLGADSDLTRSGIQFLINRTKLSKCPVDLSISLGLKHIDGNTLKAVATVLDELVLQ